MTRLNEISPGESINIPGILLISRDLSYHKFLEPSELSTLGRCIIEFPPYTSNQIKDILWDRVKLAFKPRAINDEILEFISDLIVKPPFNGDVRVALDLLLYSGNLAENLGFDRILPEHVRRVYAETHPGITTEDILDLSDRGKLVLLGLVRALKNQKRAYVGLKEIREAYKLNNLRLLQIHFHTIRHWKATIEYAKTRDILHVMKVLGHRNIKNTLIYTHLVEGLRDDEFVCKVAKTPEEIAQLIEAGFEYVCEHDGLKFFRKRK